MDDDERQRSDEDQPEPGGGNPQPSGPQSPAPPPEPPAMPPPPGGAPFPMGPQSPVSQPQAPAGAPPPAFGQPPAPGGPPPGPEQPGGTAQQPGYGGPVPPGGWQQPVAPPPPAAPLYSGQLASWGSRLGAWFIDGLVILAAVIVIGLIIAGLFLASDTAGIVGAAIFGITGLAAIIAYAPVLLAREGAHNGQTWGKQAMSIRVVRTDGQRIGGGFAALREIVLKGLAVSVASLIIPLIPWFLNYFWPLWDDENRALHDMAINTRVVMT